MPEMDARLVQELVDLVSRWQEGNGSMLTDLANEIRMHRASLSELQRGLGVATTEFTALSRNLESLSKKFDNCFENRQLRYNEINKAAEEKIKSLSDDYKKFRDTDFADIRNKVMKYSGAIALAAASVGFIIAHFAKSH